MRLAECRRPAASRNKPQQAAIFAMLECAVIAA